MARNTSYMFVTGPDVVKAVTHEEVSQEALGGASVHSEKSGVCHVAADSEGGHTVPDPQAAWISTSEQHGGRSIHFW